MDDVGIKNNFGKLPHWLIDYGVLPTLKGNDIKVLYVLIRRADYKIGNGRVGNRRIAEESGVNLGSISQCIRNLKFAGVIKVWRKGWVRYYKILPKFNTSSEAWRIFDEKPDKIPKKSVVYPRDSQGRFIREKCVKTI